MFLQNEALSALYIIQKGRVKITFNDELLGNPSVFSLKCNTQDHSEILQSSKELSVEKAEGSYFGEWTLLGQDIGTLSAVAMDDVVCSILTKEKFDLVVGPFAKLSQDDQKYV